jgi:phenylpropionate dioxygenase-like ring-hydroxylating dioxygenase large terminal subunit
MLTREENEFLCRTDKGTPMGEFCRRFWTPVLLSEEIPEPDCPPVQSKIYGEELVVFRTTSGKVGVLKEFCPHRRASLFYGRNEEEGLRCAYHGWKFDINGDCVDMPSEPAESNFKDKVKIKAYPCRERNGVIWTYMGPRTELPPLPDLEANMVPEGEWAIANVMRSCNFVQALEGDIDTSHLGFLHLGAVDPAGTVPGSFDYYTVNIRNPRYKIMDTDYGTSYAAYRDASDGNFYWRFAHFLLPFYTMIPTGVLGVQILARAWVPIDDDHTMFWNMMVPSTRQGNSAGQGGSAPPRRGVNIDGKTGAASYIPNGTGWYDRWNLTQNADNDYMIDRVAQRTGQNFTGIDGIYLQDQVVTEAMGAIVDRTKEHLGTSDTMVIKTRRRLMSAARNLQEGIVPEPVDHPEMYALRSGGVVLSKETDWLEGTSELRKAFVKHPGLSTVQ